MRFALSSFQRFSASSLALVGFMVVQGPLHAEEARIVPSGVDQQIDFFASVNPDCSSPGLPTVRLVEGPNRGVVTTDKARDFKTFPRSNVRFACNKKRVPGLKLFYRSEKGFMGLDRVRVLIISASGSGREETYAIQAR